MGTDNSEAADAIFRTSEMGSVAGPPVPIVGGSSFRDQVLDQLSEIGVRTAHIESNTEALVHNFQAAQDPLTELIERTGCLCIEKEFRKLENSIVGKVREMLNAWPDES